MNINDFQTEEKTRLDPACWHNKKIGNPKTKIKGGVRVNNCVPKEGMAEGSDNITAVFSGYGNYMKGRGANVFKHYGITVLDKQYDEDEDIAEYTVSGSKEALDQARAYLERSDQFGGMIIKQGVAEAYNPEYDDEAGMAQGSLHTLQNAVEGLQQVIDAGDNLPEWCQEKISLAEDYLVTVWDYIQSEKAQGIDPEIEEMYEAMESLAEEMARRNRVSVDRVWESFEAMDDHMLYETAAWKRKEGKNKNGGLNAKGVASYRRENPGSKLQTAVTTKPSKLKPGSKAAKRRKSFCARMSGVKGPMKKPNGKPTRKALALRKWNC